MTTELYWHGQEDVDVFHDQERNRKYWPSERPHEVPDDAVDWYLSFGGWERELLDEDEQEESDEFEALSFVEDSWQVIQASVLNGEVDPHLDKIEDVEMARMAGPRKSVMEAIDSRRQALPEYDEE